jgi:hypothetical protein
MAECECGDGLQAEELIFWDCKRYGEQRATVRDILSENSKKGYPKSVTELVDLYIYSPIRHHGVVLN